MDLYDLGHVSWLDSQLLYHALSRTRHSGVILLAPDSPYVCVGYHQNATQEVDLPYCQAHSIPVFRREVGGGAVYLDGQQLFYQIVFPPDHPAAEGTKEALYQRLLEPVAQTYRDFGIPAGYKPVNDILVNGRKISGNGAAEIAGRVVLVGNLILDFDHETMARVLRVPDEKFRDKVCKSLKDNLTTMRRELGTLPSVESVKASLVTNLGKVLGPLHPAALPDDVYTKARELEPELTTQAWLLRRGRTLSTRDVKVASGVRVVERTHKAPGGLVRAIAEVRDSRLFSVEFSGDFFIYPAGALDDLQAILADARLDQVEAVIAEFYAGHGIQSPGVTPADLAAVLAV
jgi:lipoate-protein ligase A